MHFLLKLCAAALLFLSCAFAADLDDYVWREDENYGWVDMGPEYQIKGTFKNRGYTGYTLNMTSQRWLTDADFSPDSQAGSIWWHYLVVIVPDEVRYTRNASLWITGGSQGSSPPTGTDEDILVSAALAMNTGMVIGALFQVPNEHITFSSDPIQKSRSEDAIIAFTWQHYLDDTSNPEWLVRFPMVKAAVRAMDAVTEYTAQKLPELGASLDYYTVAGASKRGWTTWLVGAVDPNRVMAIIPVVLDAINFVDVEHHEFRSYGGWSFALSDYTDLNLTQRFDDPNMIYLQQQIDPYFYKERLTMPKLVVNAGMDEFQQPDDTHYWWSGMPEPKHFMMLPNAEHSLITGILEAVPAISAWAQALLHNDEVPSMHWTISEEDGTITATVGDVGVVHSAHVWWANSCGDNAFDGGKLRRDFRISSLDNPCNCGIYIESAGMCTNLKSWWNKQELELTMVDGKRTYTAHVDAPEDGRWVAYFIDIRFVNKHAFEFMKDDEMNAAVQMLQKKVQVEAADGAKVDADESGRLRAWNMLNEFDQFAGFPTDLLQFLEFTTEVSVWPNTWAYPDDCFGDDCGTTLV